MSNVLDLIPQDLIYYREENIVIIHDDCRNALGHLPKVDLVLTDPPYGVSVNHNKGRRAKNTDTVYCDESPVDVSVLSSFRAIIWGGNNFCDQLPISTGWLVWNKYHPEKSQHSQAELAWTNCIKTIRLYSEAYHGFMRSKDGWLHPTQKPARLMAWCLSLVPDAHTIIDPYMGSGPVGIACKWTGRKYIGIEIEKKYCDIAIDRLRQEVLPLNQPESRVMEQEPLL